MKLQYEQLYLAYYNVPLPEKVEERDKYESIIRGLIEASGWNIEDFNVKMVLQKHNLN